MLPYRSSGYIMLNVLLFCPRMWRCVGFPTLEQATCSLPCEKHGLRRLNPKTFSVSPCACLYSWRNINEQENEGVSIEWKNQKGSPVL